MHIYRIYDGGDYWDYSSPDAQDAIDEHLQINYEDADLPRDDWPKDLKADQLPDDKVIAIRDAGPNGETVTMKASEWAAAEQGLIGTTCV
jgi:hypothetical protein